MVVLTSRGNKAALVLTVASLVAYGGMALLVTGPRNTPFWLLGYAAQWALYLGLFAIRREGEFVASPRVLLLWALAARLCLTTTSPWLSDDLYRYLLDGRVFAAGLNPYQFPPANPAVAVVAGDLIGHVNHPDVPTIYPPLVQLLGLLAHWLRLGADGWRVMTSFADVAAMLVVVRVFRGGERGWRAGAVYGLCPLAIWESGANGHLEAWTALALLLGVWALQRRRPILGGLGLGAAALLKLYPLLLLPALWRERGFAKALPVALVTFALGFAPFLRGGVDVAAGLRAYLTHWSFNSPVYDMLHLFSASDAISRALPFAVILAAGLVAGARRIDPRRSMPFLLFGFLVVGPTLHPWYALWVLPWLGDRPHSGLWAFVAAMGGAYAVWWEVARRGVWELPPGMAALIWALVALGWLASLRRDGGSAPLPAA